MHMLIRVLVPAVDSSEAVSTARYALDRLIGIGDGSSTEFDYYKTLDESTARYRDHPHYGGLDHVSVMSRERGVFSSNGSQPTYVVERGLRPEAPRRGAAGRPSGGPLTATALLYGVARAKPVEARADRSLSPVAKRHDHVDGDLPELPRDDFQIEPE